MQFTSPVYRFGAVISANSRGATKFAKTKTRVKSATLGASDSRHLGRLIVRHKDDYQKVFSDALLAEGIQLHFEEAECKVYLTPGVVIDFPCFAIDWPSGIAGSYRVLGRPCLATCLNKSQSKIWFRFILTGQLPPQPEEDRLVKGYFEFVQRLSQSLISIALQRYSLEFSQFFDADIQMRHSYTVQFICGDMLGADDLFDLEPKKVFDKVGTQKPGIKGILTASEPGTISDAKYIEFNIDNGEKGVFVRMFGRKKAILKGLYLYSRRSFQSADRVKKQSDVFYQHSGALGLTAGLANIIGQAF